MLKRAPIGAALRGLIPGALPVECDQLRCLVTASLLLQHSLSAWRAQQHQRSVKTSSTSADTAPTGPDSAFTGPAGCESSTAVSNNDAGSNTQHVSQLLQSLDEMYESKLSGSRDIPAPALASDAAIPAAVSDVGAPCTAAAGRAGKPTTSRGRKSRAARGSSTASAAQHTSTTSSEHLSKREKLLPLLKQHHHEATLRQQQEQQRREELQRQQQKQQRQIEVRQRLALLQQQLQQQASAAQDTQQQAQEDVPAAESGLLQQQQSCDSEPLSLEGVQQVDTVSEQFAEGQTRAATAQEHTHELADSAAQHGHISSTNIPVATAAADDAVLVNSVDLKEAATELEDDLLCKKQKAAMQRAAAAQPGGTVLPAPLQMLLMQKPLKNSGTGSTSNTDGTGSTVHAADETMAAAADLDEHDKYGTDNDGNSSMTGQPCSGHSENSNGVDDHSTAAAADWKNDSTHEADLSGLQLNAAPAAVVDADLAWLDIVTSTQQQGKRAAKAVGTSSSSTNKSAADTLQQQQRKDDVYNPSDLKVSVADAASLCEYNDAVQQLQWPDGLPLLAAIQCGMMQLEGKVSAAGPSTTAAPTAAEEQEPPFAWMYADSSSRNTSSSSSSTSVAWVVDQIQRMDAWRFEHSSSTRDCSSSSSFANLQLWQTQRKAYWLLLQKLQQQLRGTLAGGPNAEPQQQQQQLSVQQIQQLLQQLASQMHLLSENDEPHDNQYDSAAAVGQHADLSPVARPVQCDRSLPVLRDVGRSQYDPVELDVLRKVLHMSRGTALQNALWSQVTGQRTVLRRGALQTAGAQQVPVSVPSGCRRQQQHEHAALQDRSQQQQQQRIRGDVQHIIPTAEWFGPLLFAAFSAIRVPGSLLVAATPNVRSLTAELPVEPSVAVLSVDNQPVVHWPHAMDTHLEYHSEQQMAKTLERIANLRLQYQWGVLTEAEQQLDTHIMLPQEQQQQQQQRLRLHGQQQGMQQSVQDLQRQQRHQLYKWAEQQQQHSLWQQQQLHEATQAAAAAGSTSKLGSGIVQVVEAQADAASLLKVLHEYGHYISGSTDLVAAVAIQAGRVWTTPAAVREQLPQVQQELQCQQQQQQDSASSSEGKASMVDLEAAVAEAVPAVKLQLQPAAELAASQQLYSELIHLLTAPQVQPVNLASLWGKSGSSISSVAVAAATQQAAAPVATADTLADLFCWAVALPDIVSASSDSLMTVMSILSSTVALQQISLRSLIKLYGALMDWDSLAHWSHPQQYQAGQLYSAIVQQLATRSVLLPGGTFVGVERELLQIATHACTACAVLAPPGGWQATATAAVATVRPLNKAVQRQGDAKQQAVHPAAAKLLHLPAWRKSALQVLPVSQAVQQAAAQGQLQQIAAVLAQLFRSTESQASLQLGPDDLAQLLQAVAATKPYHTFESFAQAVSLTSEADVDVDAKGLWKGSLALSSLSSSIVQHLTTPATHQEQLQLQQQSQLQEDTQQQPWWWWWKQQQQQQLEERRHQHRASMPFASLSPGAAMETLTVLRDAECYSEFKLMTDALITAEVLVPGSSSSSQPLLHTWRPSELFEFLTLVMPKASLKFSYVSHSGKEQRIFDRTAAALVWHIDLLSGMLSTSSTADGTVGRRRLLPPKRGGSSSTGPGLDDQAAGCARDSPGQQEAYITQQLDGISSIVHVFTQQRQYHPAVLDALGELLITTRAHGVRFLQPEALARFAVALAYFDHCSVEAAKAAGQWTAAVLRNCSVPLCAQLAWTLSVLDVRDAQLWSSIKNALEQAMRHGLNEWRRKSRKRSGTTGVQNIWGGGALSRLYQANMFVEHCVDGLRLLSPEVAALAAESWFAGTRESVTVSRAQRSVAHSISALQAAQNTKVKTYEIEYKTQLSSVDILVKIAGRNVVVEFDGPHHYASNSAKKRLGPSELRDRLLAAQGYRVLPLPTFVWEQLPKVNKADFDTLSPEGLRQFEAWLVMVAKTGKVPWQEPQLLKQYMA